MSLVTIVKLWLNGLSLDVGPTGFKHHIHIHSLLMGFFSGISIVSTPPKLRGGHNFRIGDRGGLSLRHLKGGGYHLGGFL